MGNTEKKNVIRFDALDALGMSFLISAVASGVVRIIRAIKNEPEPGSNIKINK